MVRDVRYITLNCCYRDLQNVLMTGHLKTLALVESAGEASKHILEIKKKISDCFHRFNLEVIMMICLFYAVDHVTLLLLLLCINADITNNTRLFVPGGFYHCIDQSSAQLVQACHKPSKILTETFNGLIGGGVCSELKEKTSTVLQHS